MDRQIYIAMTGAKQLMEKQATVANNLANVSTSGFRAQLDAIRAVPVVNSPLATRAFAVDSTIGTDFSVGPIQQTGRDLDVAIQGKGWFAVERADGSEGYTRAGSLKINENGVLQTQSGLNVLGDSGPISVPPDVKITIGKDGTISSVEAGSKPGSTIQVGRLKLVNPDEANIVRAEDGFFVTKDGEPAETDANVAVIGGAVEGSNVNVVQAMVDMISLSRNYEMHIDSLKRAESNDAKANEFLALS